MIFLAPFSPKGSPQPDGPLITDDSGDLVWFKPVRRGTAVTDLKVQRLGGRPRHHLVGGPLRGRLGLRRLQGLRRSLPPDRRRSAPATGSRPTCTTCSSPTAARRCCSPTTASSATCASSAASRRAARRQRRPGGRPGDRARAVRVAQRSGRSRSPTSRTRPEGPRSWDYFHINSVEEDADGDLIISARNTCALYKLDRDTGEIVWQLGGKGGDFRMGKGTRFCFQHDARRAGRGRISLFDNSAGPPVAAPAVARAGARGSTRAAKRVRLRARSTRTRAGSSPSTRARTRVQPNGNVFVGWGAAPVFSEFSPGGRLLFDGRLTKGKGNYRAIREPWTGRPAHAARDRRRAHAAPAASGCTRAGTARPRSRAGRCSRGAPSRAARRRLEGPRRASRPS